MAKIGLSTVPEDPVPDLHFEKYRPFSVSFFAVSQTVSFYFFLGEVFGVSVGASSTSLLFDSSSEKIMKRLFIEV